MARSVYRGGYQPMSPLPLFADQAAAYAGGLDEGDVFAVTSTGAVTQVLATTTTTTTTTAAPTTTTTTTTP